MTENKRFTIKRKDLKYAKILENGKDLTGYFFIAQAEFICDKWNELSEENEQLKKDFDSVSHNWALMYNEAKNKVEELSKENKKLKSINNQLEDRLEESGIGNSINGRF